MNSTLLVTIVDFVEKHSSAELVKLLKFSSISKEEKEKGIDYKVITTIVAKAFNIKPLLIIDGGNNQAIYRNACYYFHQKYDQSYSIKRMVDLYGKLPNSVRNGIKNIENIMSDPRVNKAYYRALVKIDTGLSEIDLWQKRAELDQIQTDTKISELKRTQE